MKPVNKYIVLLHVTGSLLFLSQPIWLSAGPPPGRHFLFSPPMLRDLTANALMLAFFYLHYFVIIPRLFFREKYLVYASTILAGLLVVCLFPSLLTGRSPFAVGSPSLSMPPPFQRPGGGPPPRMRMDSAGSFYEGIKHHVFPFIAVVSFSLLLQMWRRWYQAEAARHQAQLASLKAQINPHFLFNTLNSIYSLAVRKDDRTADAIVNLSELMRYVLTDVKDNRILLRKELDYIRNYIDLQRSRLGDTVRIQYSTEEEFPPETLIAPLILISFIENAFKYGVNPDLPSVISIQIRVKEEVLLLQVQNNKVAAANELSSSGIGVENTRDRLLLLYPGKHQLSLFETDKNYQVNLSIQLT
ncbi:MAG: sensor histidine kinase [Candidatus Pseudobacter hemicellulosilyticus]|uniref:Sensor histidine kinase n=1 Tax=Candidatus Pseudobacter hemicellulosilyticus TaxID=3121375 RepID=A0AAJ6BI75_9BACT|nr:MAG: sensor histidine kinase [Pseudobacter sp.]